MAIMRTKVKDFNFFERFIYDNSKMEKVTLTAPLAVILYSSNLNSLDFFLC